MDLWEAVDDLFQHTWRSYIHHHWIASGGYHDHPHGYFSSYFKKLSSSFFKISKASEASKASKEAVDDLLQHTRRC